MTPLLRDVLVERLLHLLEILAQRDDVRAHAQEAVAHRDQPRQ